MNALRNPTGIGTLRTEAPYADRLNSKEHKRCRLTGGDVSQLLANSSMSCYSFD